MNTPLVECGSRRANLRILIADDQRSMRDAISLCIRRSKSAYRYEIVGEAATGREAIRRAAETNPDVIVMDADMPDMNGADATREILKKQPHVKILAISAHDEEAWICGMLVAGVVGFILKDDMKNLPAAIDSVAVGKTYFSQDVAAVVVNTAFHRQGEKSQRNLVCLTDREREVLHLIGRGTNKRAIASSLPVSLRTVEAHRQNIMNKLDIHKADALVDYAVKSGISAINPTASKPPYHGGVSSDL